MLASVVENLCTTNVQAKVMVFYISEMLVANNAKPRNGIDIDMTEQRKRNAVEVL